MTRAFFLAILCIGAVLLQSCKKEIDEVKSTTELVRGIWNIDSVSVHQEFNNVTKKETLYSDPGDYIDFRSDGRMITIFQGNKDNSSYKIKNSQVITIAGDSGAIRELTNTRFVIHTRASAGGIGFIETTYFLSR